MRLNLGSSDAHEGGFLNVDLCLPANLLANLDDDWPWRDSSIEYIRAWDIFEHLPDKIHTLNEAYRVLSDGGILEIMVPTTDGRGADQDPTHRSYWNPNSLFYLEYGNPHNTRFATAYGMRHQFRIVHKKHEPLIDMVWKLHAVLQVVK